MIKRLLWGTIYLLHYTIHILLFMIFGAMIYWVITNKSIESTLLYDKSEDMLDYFERKMDDII